MDSVALKTLIGNNIEALPNPSDVLKSRSASIDIFHKTTKHPDIYPQIQGYEAAITKMQVGINGDDENKNEALSNYFKKIIDRKKFIKYCTSARNYGYAILEITEFKEKNGLILPTKIALCPPESFYFKSDGSLMLYGNGNDINCTEQYPNKFIAIQHDSTLKNPYGVGLLEVGFWLAVGLNGNFEFMLQFAEEDGRDKWLGKVPNDAKQTQINQLLNALVNLRNNGTAVIKEGMNVDPMHNSGRSDSKNLYKDIDEMLRRKVEKLWTGTDLTMQVQGKGGYSSSQSGLEIREDALDAGVTLATDGIKKLIEIIGRLNNIDYSDIEINLHAARSLDKTTAEIDQIYFNAGMKPTKELLIKRGYSENDFEFTDVSEETNNDTDFSSNSNDTNELLSGFEYLQQQIIKKKA